MTAITVVVLTSSMHAPVSAVPFIEYTDWADMSDVVAVSRAAVGDPVPDYKWSDVIRLDVDLDNEITQHDADLMLEYVTMYDMFDTICSLDISDTKERYRMEMSERFNTPIQYCRVFYGFRPDQVVKYNPDCVMIDQIFTIADGGCTGYAIQEDPYIGDITYENQYSTGDIVIVFNVFTGGDPTVIQTSSECLIGNVTDLGFEYTPRPEIVANALRNME